MRRTVYSYNNEGELEGKTREINIDFELDVTSVLPSRLLAQYRLFPTMSNRLAITKQFNKDPLRIKTIL